MESLQGSFPLSMGSLTEVTYLYYHTTQVDHA